MQKSLRNMLRSAMLVLVAAAPLGAAAVEVEGGIRSELSWDSNVFNDRDDEVDDFFVRIQPFASLADRRGDLEWRVRYQPSYRAFLDTHEGTGWDHDVLGSLTWRIRPDLTLELRDRFARVDSLSRFQEADPGVVEDPDLDPTVDFELGTRRTKRNRFTGNLSWQAGPTHFVQVSVNHSIDDFQEAIRGDNTVMGATLRYFHSLSARNSLGGGFSVSQSTFEPVTGEERDTRFYNLFGSWRFLFDPTLELSASLGPALIDQDVAEIASVGPTTARFPLRQQGESVRFVDASTCPIEDGVRVLSAQCETVEEPLIDSVFGQPSEVARFGTQTITLPVDPTVDDPEEQSFTVFANASLVKRWESAVLRLSFRREETTSSGLGSATVGDLLTLSLGLDPSPRLHLDLIGSWSRRTLDQETFRSFVRVEGTDVLLECPGLALGGGFCAFSDAMLDPQLERRPLTLRNVATAEGLRLVEVSREREAVTWVAQLRARYRLRRNVYLTGRASYRRSEFEGDDAPTISADRYLFAVGVEYRFDPLHL